MRPLIYIIGIVTLLSIPGAYVSAVSLSASTLTQDLHIGDQFSVDAVINTNEYEINALSGRVEYNPAVLSLESLWNGNSIVPLWVEGPEEETPGVITFSGTIPGGFEGRAGHLFTLIFSSTTEAETAVAFKDLTMLTNERRPKILSVDDVSVPVSIVSGSGLRSAITATDTTPPNSFIPEVAYGPDIFNGKYFLIFHTTDDSSGIAYYELLESSERIERRELSDSAHAWERAVSPVVLSDQTLSQYVYVRAVDRAGNAQIAEVFPGSSTPQRRYDTMRMLSIIGIVAGAVCVLYWVRARRKRNNV